MTDRIDTERAKLQLNARHHRPDQQMERVLHMFHNDRDAYDRLPASAKSQAATYLDFKEAWERAVAAGLLPANDRGPSAA